MVFRTAIRCVVLGWLAIALGSVGHATFAASDLILIDRVWSGTSVNYGATSDGVALTSAYYNADRRLTVASTSLIDGRTTVIGLGEIFDGWDAHKNTIVTISKDKVIHVLANMHDTALVYYRSKPAGGIDTLHKTSMIGTYEQHVTYPTFLSCGDDLCFLYREGGAGAGDWLIDRYSHGKWSRIGTIFSSDLGSTHVSAYPSPFVPDRAGNFHVVIVWRRSADVASNFAVTYAATRDFRTWIDPFGNKREGPLRFQDADLIEETGFNAGLLNNARMVISEKNEPIVFYFKYATDGKNALIAGWPETQGRRRWIKKTLAVSAFRTEIAGGGSLPEMPRSHVELAGGVIHVSLKFSKERERKFLVDPDTLEIVSGNAEITGQDRSEQPTLPEAQSLGTKEATTMRSPVSLGPGSDAPVVGQLLWSAEKTDNDHPRSCGGTQAACRFTSNLYFRRR